MVPAQQKNGGGRGGFGEKSNSRRKAPRTPADFVALSEEWAGMANEMSAIADSMKSLDLDTMLVDGVTKGDRASTLMSEFLANVESALARARHLKRQSGND